MKEKQNNKQTGIQAGTRTGIRTGIRVTLPALIAAVLCTAVCVAIVSQWYFRNQKGQQYQMTLVGKVVSNGNGQLQIAGDVTNPKGRNESYYIRNASNLAIYDTKKQKLSFDDLQPGDPVSVFYSWNIPKYVTPDTTWEDNFSLEKDEVIPGVIAVARLDSGQSGVDINFFTEKQLSTFYTGINSGSQ